ncbi:hypothetical protein L6452_34825 [Arctium lappa]|uniref:Uncharacterized protein n=1 Tax=Arctium lappa TaxID=4217 RepID=A0ACB8YJ99_ARCLA|nr:hypothetical protein L6452_34825 [Arctium lappa]
MDNASLHYIRLFHAVVYDLHVDYTYIFWTELSERVQDKLTHKKRKFIPFIRYLKLIIRSMLRSNPAIPRRLSWPQVPDTEMTYIQKPKQSFNYSMTIPNALIANYADMTDDSVVQYCMENDFLEADQDEPSHDAQAASFHTEKEVDTAVEQEDDDDDTAAGNDLASDKDGDDDDTDENDGNDGDQPDIRVYERKSKEPKVHIQEDVMSEEESIPINAAIVGFHVDELDLAFANASTHHRVQDSTVSLSCLEVSSTVDTSSVEVRDTTEKFTNLNEVIRQLNERFEEQKNEEIQKLKALFKGKMPEIDTSMISEVIPFRRPSGVVIRQLSSTFSTASAIVSIPLPPPFMQSVGLSSSVPSTTTCPPVSSSIPVSDLPISELSDMFYAPRTNFSDIKEALSLMTQALTALSDRFDHHDLNCRTEAGPSLKRRHDQDDPDPQGHEGEMAKRQRVEGSSVRDDQTQENVADKEKSTDNVQDCNVEDLVHNMLESVDLSAMPNMLNISQHNIENNMQIVVYEDPDFASKSVVLDDSEIANDMRSFFANFIEINSDHDDNIIYEKICKVKEEEYEDIVVISDTEDDSIFMDEKDEEIADLLYRDLPSQEEIPEASPSTSITAADTSPTTTAPSGTFEVGQSSRAQADVPPSEPSNIFVSRRRPINIHAILGVEKESEEYQYEYLMFIKCQCRGKNLISSPHLIVRVMTVKINKFVNIWYLYHRTQDISQALFVIKRFIRRQIRFYRVFDFQMAAESFQLVANLLKPNGSLPNLDSYPLFTILQDPFGVIYRNGLGQNCFLRFEEISHYSDETLKVIKLQLEQRLKNAQRILLETRRNLYQFENDEIQLLKNTLNIIGEKLILRSTLRRLEVLLGLNRLRQREERQ